MSVDTSVVQVTNIAPSVNLEQMNTLFSYVGHIKDIRIYPSDDPSAQQKVCYVKFADAISAGVAQHLTNTVFIDRALIVQPVPENRIPDESTALNMTNTGSSGGSNSGVVSQVVTGVGGTQVITTIDPRLTALGLPQYPPLPANMDPSKIEEIRRTVYVGNLDSTILAEQLLRFFNQIGEIKYVRMAGDEAQPTRFAFIEFTEQSSVANALQYNGVILGGRPLKINHSNNAIVKPQAKSTEAAQKEIEEAMKRVREAQSLISAAIEPGYSKILELIETKKQSPSCSPPRTRTRDRSRSKSRRSRSRSRGSRSRTLRSPSRDLTRRSWRDRSRERRRSRDRRSRSRERALRSRSRERVVRSRSRDRRHRRRSVSKERDRAKHRRSRSRDKGRSNRRKRSRSRSISRGKKVDDFERDRDKKRESVASPPVQRPPVLATGPKEESEVTPRGRSISQEPKVEGPALPPDSDLSGEPEVKKEVGEEVKDMDLDSDSEKPSQPVRSGRDSPSVLERIAEGPSTPPLPKSESPRSPATPPLRHRSRSRSPDRVYVRRSPSPSLHRRRSRSRNRRSRSRSFTRIDRHKRKKDRDRDRDRDRDWDRDRDRDRSRSRDRFREKKRKRRSRDRSPDKGRESSRVVRDYDEEEKGYDSDGNKKSSKVRSSSIDRYLSPRD